MRTQRWTYVVQGEHGGPIKIGIAERPLQRLTSLQTGNPHKLRVVAMFKGERFENLLHDRYKQRRLHGEWFEESVLADVLADPPAEVYTYKTPPPDRDRYDLLLDHSEVSDLCERVWAIYEATCDGGECPLEQMDAIKMDVSNVALDVGGDYTERCTATETGVFDEEITLA